MIPGAIFGRGREIFQLRPNQVEIGIFVLIAFVMLFQYPYTHKPVAGRLCL
jgi:hypothetical protein